MLFASEPQVIAAPGAGGWVELLEAVPAGPGVFAVWPREGEPYLGKTGLLRRRLKRLLAGREGSRLLNLRALAERIEYWTAASQLERSLLIYELARRHLPRRYAEYLKLRPAPFVQLLLANSFPRTRVTTRPGAGTGVVYGPFRSRAAAEEFERGMLDLFQLRRCQEDLEPRPDHPGCIYGEMNMCLRPCQEVVGAEEYASEAARVGGFLRSDGAHLLEAARHARERFSASLEFEEAARQHKRVERIEAVLRMREDLARDVESLHGVAVLPSSVTGEVSLLFLLNGRWAPRQAFPVTRNAAPATSMDSRLRELVRSLPAAAETGPREREEHLALFARWYFSSWRDGVWISFPCLEAAPWRRVVSAISRTAAAIQSADEKEGTAGF